MSIILSVLGVLLALGALFLFISQQDDIGTGSFTSTQAMLFVGLYLPTYLFQLMPVGALIGAMLGLGNLARGSELVVMRASGVTTARLCVWLGAAGLILALVMTGIGEVVAPPLEKYARQLKVFSKFSEFNAAGSRSSWSKDGPLLVNIRQQTAGNMFGGMYLFELGPNREVLRIVRADRATDLGGSTWQLDNYAETRLGPERAEAVRGAARQIQANPSWTTWPRCARSGRRSGRRPAPPHQQAAPPPARPARSASAPDIRFPIPNTRVPIP